MTKKTMFSKPYIYKLNKYLFYLIYKTANYLIYI